MELLPQFYLVILMINYYEIEIKGKHINRFLDKIIKERINIFDIKYKKDMITFKVSYQDYQRVVRLKTIYQINIKDIKGFNRYKNITKFYKVFFLFLILEFFLIIIYANMIFKIKINTTNEELSNLIKKDLKNNHVTIYSFKKSFSKLNKLIASIKKNNSDQIEWISITKDGVSYEINLIEKIIKNKENSLGASHIIAKENGYIKDMYVTKGQVLKNNGDYVTKGEIIVSGFITKNDDIKNTVNATGKIYAEVWYKVTASGKKSFLKQKNEQGLLKINFNIFNKEITLISFKIKKLDKSSIKRIIKNDLFSLVIKKDYVKNLVEVNYNDDELIKNLESQAKRAIEKNLLSKEYIILQKTLKNTKDNDRIYLEVFFKVYKDITEHLKINIS